jgi:hypothetical protein
MKKAIILSIALLGLAANAAMAKSVSTTISMGTFKNRCLAAGGTLTNVSAGGVKCRLPSGATVTCYDTDGPGLSCDYRTVNEPKIPRILGNPQSVSPDEGSKGPRAESGGNTVGGNNTQGGGKGDTAAGADSGPDSMGNGDGGPAVN